MDDIRTEVFHNGFARPGSWLVDVAGAAPLRHADTGIWQVFAHADVQRVLADHEHFSSEQALGPEEANDPLAASMVLTDPPRHRQLRALVTEAFTPRSVTRMEPRIREIAQELLDAMRPAGAADFVQAFSYPLPARVIAELLGVPFDRRDDFRRWSDDAVTSGMSVDLSDSARASAEQIGLFFFELMEQRRLEPREDLISGLLRAEVNGQRLHVPELIGFCVLLLIAGHETTANLLNHAVWCLTEHPEAASRLRQDPALVPRAIEEVLRFRSPVFGLARRAKIDTELGGRRIAAGDLLFAWISAANRDPAVFADPDRFDIERSPNRHIAFGHGIHFCLGGPLARLEAAVALPMVLAQLPNLRLSDDEPPEEMESVVITGFRRLPVRYSPGT
jgi:cytochrome P450